MKDIYDKNGQKTKNNSDDPDAVEELGKGGKFFMGVGISLAVMAAIEIFCIFIIVRCYLYLKEKVANKRLSEDLSLSVQGTKRMGVNGIDPHRPVERDGNVEGIP